MRRVPGGGDGALLEVEGRYRSLQVPQEEVPGEAVAFCEGRKPAGSQRGRPGASPQPQPG